MWLSGHRLNQATDAEVDPSGEAAAGSPISSGGETEPYDEGPEATSPISSGGETDAARVLEELTSHSDGMERHG